ncbi:MAG: restriction endonuclease [Candidatus Hodarchaeales archaeon]
MKNNLELLNLEELTLKYCRQRGFVADRFFHRHGDSRINLLIQNGDDDESIGVIIKDWRRSVGVDIIIRAEHVLKDNRSLAKILIVANHFSDPARFLAEKIGIFLLTRGDLIRILSLNLGSSSVGKSDKQEDIIMY